MKILSHLYLIQRACGDLLQSQTFDCTTPLQGGVGNESRLIFILRQDLLTAAASTSTQDLISAITLVANKVAVVFEGFRQSAKPKYSRVAAPSGQSMYKHEMEYSVFAYDQQTKNNLARLANGRYVVIFENAKQDLNAFEVMGLNVGLEVIEMERAPQDNGGAVKIKITTPENEFESKMPQTLSSGTDYATNLGLINALCALPTITTIAPLAAVAAGGTALTITGTKYFGGGTNNAVLSLQWINQATQAVVNQVAYTVASDVSITCNSQAMVAGLYKLKITTIRGNVISVSNLVVT
jgi:hypothetical protein